MHKKWLYSMIVAMLVTSSLTYYQANKAPMMMAIRVLISTTIWCCLLYSLVVKHKGWRLLSFWIGTNWMNSVASLFMDGILEGFALIIPLIPFTIYSIPLIRENYRSDACKYYTWCVAGAIGWGFLLGVLMLLVSPWAGLALLLIPPIGFWLTRKSSMMIGVPGCAACIAILIFFLAPDISESSVGDKLDSLAVELNAQFQPMDFDEVLSGHVLIDKNKRSEIQRIASKNESMVDDYMEKINRMITQADQEEKAEIEELIFFHEKVLSVWENFVLFVDYVDAHEESFYLSSTGGLRTDESEIGFEAGTKLNQFFEAQDELRNLIANYQMITKESD